MQPFYKLLTFIPLLSMVLSCDDIDIDDRWEGPIVTDVGKNILIEDFTGQNCSNCPLAHAEAEKLLRTYGNDRIVVVAIHGGPQAVDESNPKSLGLANEQSKAYNRLWGSFSYPKGTVDRKGGLLDFEKWNAAILQRIGQQSRVRLSIDDVKIDTLQQLLSFSCTTEAKSDIDARLQLWLTESGIHATQAMPATWGGGYQKDYRHQHVFRASINRPEGDSLHLLAGKKHSALFQITLRNDWDIQQLSIVMVCCTEKDGVDQVIAHPLFPK